MASNGFQIEAIEKYSIHKNHIGVSISYDFLRLILHSDCADKTLIYFYVLYIKAFIYKTLLLETTQDFKDFVMKLIC